MINYRKKILSIIAMVIFALALTLSLSTQRIFSVAEAQGKPSTTVNNLVVYVNFKDSPTLTDTKKDQMEKTFRRENKSESFYHSIKTLSNNKLIYDTTFVGINLSVNASEYNFSASTQAQQTKAYNLYSSIVNAAAAKTPTGIDFDQISCKGVGDAPYTVGHDNKFDSMMFAYNIAESFGSSDDWGKVLWPSTISYTSGNLGSVGGKIVSTVIGIPIHMMDFGVVTHETLHSVGMQDLYPYDKPLLAPSKTAPVGIWDIMGSGSGSTVGTTTCYNISLNNYSRWWLGFIDDTQFRTMDRYTSETVAFSTSLSTSGTVAFKFGERALSNGNTEFFVAEYRNLDEHINEDNTTSINGTNNLVKKSCAKAKAGFVFYRVNTTYESGGNRDSKNKQMNDAYIMFLKNPQDDSSVYVNNFNATVATDSLSIPEQLPTFTYSNGQVCPIKVEISNFVNKELRFTEGFNYSGKVVDKNNKPIAGAQVLKNNKDSGVFTKDDGTFSISAVDGDNITFIKANYLFDNYPISNEGVGRVFTAKDAAPISIVGNVKDGKTAIQNADIFDDGVKVGETGIDGGFSITIIPLSVVTFKKDGYEISNFIAKEGQTRYDVTATKKNYTFNVNLVCGGVGIEGAVVKINGVEKENCRTDINGTVTIPDLKFSDVISFEAGGYSIPNYIVKNENVDIVLEATLADFTVFGTIRDTDGFFIAGVSVLINDVLKVTTNEMGAFSMSAKIGDKLSFAKTNYVFAESVIAYSVDELQIVSRTLVLITMTGHVFCDGVAIPNAIIKVNGFEIKKTNLDGSFSIDVFERDVLTFEKAGYDIESIIVDSATQNVTANAEKVAFVIGGATSALNDIALDGVSILLNDKVMSRTDDTGKYSLTVKIGDTLSFVKKGFTFGNTVVKSLTDKYDIRAKQGLYKLIFENTEGDMLIGLPVFVNGNEVGVTNNEGEINVISAPDDEITYIFQGEKTIIDDELNQELKLNVVIEAETSETIGVYVPNKMPVFLVVALIGGGMIVAIGALWLIKDKKVRRR